MAGRGMKYKENDHWFMKRNYKILKENDEVIIVRVYKRKKRTIVDVEDINGKLVTDVSSIWLRNKPR